MQKPLRDREHCRKWAENIHIEEQKKNKDRKGNKGSQMAPAIWQTQIGCKMVTGLQPLWAVSFKNIVCLYNVFQADLGRVALLEAWS